MTLVFTELDAERISADVTYRGRSFAIHVNPNDLTEDVAATVQAAIDAIQETTDADPQADTAGVSKYDPLVVRLVREWEIAETPEDKAARSFWPVDLAHAARLPLSCKRLIFWTMLAKMFAPDPEPLAASSPDGSGGPVSTTPLPDGPPSGTSSNPPATEESTPAS
jgi:hypothetical protein